MNNLAGSLTAGGEYDEAEALLEELLAIDQQVHPDSRSHAVHIHTYAELFLAQERWRDADVQLGEAIRIYRNTEHPYLGMALVQRAGAAAQLGRASAALNMLEEAVEGGYTRGIADNAQLSSLERDPRFAELLSAIANAS